jgi:hypothetical protein
MSLQNTINKVIAVLKAAIMVDYSVCKGIYENDQMAFSEYPVIIVGVPSLLDEIFPVIAQHTARDEKYAIEIVTYVKFEDTLVSTQQIISLTESIRSALRADMKPPLEPLGGGGVYQGDIDTSKFTFGAKGDILLRVSVTIVRYIQRIVV